MERRNLGHNPLLLPELLENRLPSLVQLPSSLITGSSWRPTAVRSSAGSRRQRSSSGASGTLQCLWQSTGFWHAPFGAELAISPGASAVAMWEHAEAFNHIVSAFLTAHPGTPDRPNN